jgi:hypothetical protein
MVKTASAPYKVSAGNQEATVELNRNSEITLVTENTTATNPGLENGNRFIVSPNPARSTLCIEFSAPAERTIAIVDIHQKILSKTTFGSSKVILNVSSLVPGAYFIKVSSKEKFQAEKFIKL